MLDIDDSDVGMVVLGLIAMSCIASAALSPMTIMDVKEIILVCVAGVAGRMGMKK